MILYKYVSFDTGLYVIKNNKIGFSQVKNFNDPFESTAFGFQKNVLPIFDQVATFRTHFSNNYAVLSLTECHLNPLMWAHYGQSHTGLVIAIDVDKAKLNDNNFIINAKKGKIKYESNLNVTSYDKERMSERLYQIGNDEYYSLDGDGGDVLRRAFLIKQKSWEYEKEVRIVKNVKSSKLSFNANQDYSDRKSFNTEDSWSCKQINSSYPLFLYHLPDGCIQTVFIGDRAIRNTQQQDHLYNLENKDQNDFTGRTRHEDLISLCKGKGIEIRQVRVNYENWELEDTYCFTGFESLRK